MYWIVKKRCRLRECHPCMKILLRVIIELLWRIHLRKVRVLLLGTILETLLIKSLIQKAQAGRGWLQSRRSCFKHRERRRRASMEQDIRQRGEAHFLILIIAQTSYLVMLYPIKFQGNTVVWARRPAKWNLTSIMLIRRKLGLQCPKLAMNSHTRARI